MTKKEFLQKYNKKGSKKGKCSDGALVFPDYYAHIYEEEQLQIVSHIALPLSTSAHYIGQAIVLEDAMIFLYDPRDTRAFFSFRKEYRYLTLDSNQIEKVRNTVQFRIDNHYDHKIQSMYQTILQNTELLEKIERVEKTGPVHL